MINRVHVMFTCRAARMRKEASAMSLSQTCKLCPLCSFEAPTIAIVLSHLRTVHSSDPNFHVLCGLGGCATTFRSFSALYSHIYRYHPDLVKKRKEPVQVLPNYQPNNSSEGTTDAPDINHAGNICNEY